MLGKSEVEIYKTSSGAEIPVTLDQDTVWLTQAQIVVLFDSSKANINEYIKHIFESQELLQEATARKFRTVQKKGSRDVSRSRNHYNLNVIISVGCRVPEIYWEIGMNDNHRNQATLISQLNPAPVFARNIE